MNITCKRTETLCKGAHTIYARTNIFKFSFVSRTVIDWNNLPHNVVEIEDDAKFHKLIIVIYDSLEIR